MYELAIQRIFSAAHAISIKGETEPIHGHDWNVTVEIGGESLDEDGLLVDFHVLEGIVDEIIEPLRNANLNDVPPFDSLNPTAENVAAHIGRSASIQLKVERVKVLAVRVTEAPGCAATYRPG